MSIPPVGEIFGFVASDNFPPLSFPASSTPISYEVFMALGEKGLDTVSPRSILNLRGGVCHCGTELPSGQSARYHCPRCLTPFCSRACQAEDEANGHHTIAKCAHTACFRYIFFVEGSGEQRLEVEGGVSIEVISAVTKLTYSLLDLYPPIIVKHQIYARLWLIAEKAAWARGTSRCGDATDALKFAKRTLREHPWPPLGGNEIKNEFSSRMQLMNEIFKACCCCHGIEMVTMMRDYEPIVDALWHEAIASGRGDGTARAFMFFTLFTRWVALLAQNKKFQNRRPRFLLQAQALGEKMVAASDVSLDEYDMCPTCFLMGVEETGSTLRASWIPDLHLAVTKLQVELAREMLRNKDKRKSYGHVHTHCGIAGSLVEAGFCEEVVVNQLVNLALAYKVNHCCEEAGATAREIVEILRSPVGEEISPSVSMIAAFESYRLLSCDAVSRSDWSACIEVAQGWSEMAERWPLDESCPDLGKRLCARAIFLHVHAEALERLGRDAEALEKDAHIAQLLDRHLGDMHEQKSWLQNRIGPLVTRVALHWARDGRASHGEDLLRMAVSAIRENKAEYEQTSVVSRDLETSSIYNMGELQLFGTFQTWLETKGTPGALKEARSVYRMILAHRRDVEERQREALEEARVLAVATGKAKGYRRREETKEQEHDDNGEAWLEGAGVGRGGGGGGKKKKGGKGGKGKKNKGAKKQRSDNGGEDGGDDDKEEDDVDDLMKRLGLEEEENGMKVKAKNKNKNKKKKGQSSVGSAAAAVDESQDNADGGGMEQEEDEQQEQEQEQEQEEEEEECPVCFFVLEGETSVLACRHSYHRHCLQVWMNTCNQKGLDCTCPYCRAPMSIVG